MTNGGPEYSELRPCTNCKDEVASFRLLNSSWGDCAERKPWQHVAKGEKVRGRKFESKDKPLQDFCGRLGTPEKGLGKTNRKLS